MTTRISYNTSNGPGRQVADFVNEVEVTIAKGRRILAQLNSISSGADWASIESECGVTAGQGQNFWTLIATAMDKIDSPQVAELARLDKP